MGCGDAARLDEIERASIEQQARTLRLEEDWRPRTEVEKIHALLDAVAASDATFLMGRRSWNGPRTRDFLRRRYVRASQRIATAEQFIVGVATRQRVTNDAYEVLTTSGRRVDLRTWLREELARLDAEDETKHQVALANRQAAAVADSKPSNTTLAASETAVATVIDSDDVTKLPASIEDPVSHERAVPNTVDYVVALVQHSRATFLAPDAPKRRGGRSTSATRYTGPDFAAMLRRKSTWIGAGIEELDPWLAEVGSRSFRNDQPYQVEHPDGRVEPFDVWVEARRHGPGGKGSVVQTPSPAGSGPLPSPAAAPTPASTQR